jgi:hypothetical protein
MRQMVLLAACVMLIGCAAAPPGGGDDGDGDDDGDDVPGEADADVDPPDPDEPDAAPDPVDESCGAWMTGTLTGYNNADSADDPHSGNLMEFTNLNQAFYDNVEIAAVDLSDWGPDQYRWIDVKWNGVIGRVGVWDACRNEDCPDGTDCCTNNKELFAFPGYLVDVEQHTAARLWGVQDAENTLQDEIELRLCAEFDPDQIANMYGVYR